MSYLPLLPGAGVTINGLGDSGLGHAACTTISGPDARFPLWAASTNYATPGMAVRTAAGNAFALVTAGTSASSGTGPLPNGSSNITDGTAVWQFLSLGTNKMGVDGGNAIAWAEVFSNGVLSFDQASGYCGYSKTYRNVIVVNGGSNYTNPTVTLANGASATATVVGGVITAVTITNPGYGSLNYTATVSDPTGSGAILSGVCDGTGTFAVSGCTTADCVARLPDVVASPVQIIVDLSGANDITANVPYATIIANKRYIYETEMAAGKRVVAMTIRPRSASLTQAQLAVMDRVNHWIRSYCRGATWANPNRLTTNIALADATGLLLDPTTLGQDYPIGGNGGTPASVTVDGSHTSTRGGMYEGMVVWQAMQRWVGPASLSAAMPRAYSARDGYDPVVNPGGNLMEAPMAWTASTAYVAGSMVYNGGNVYSCTTGGNSASSGGPTTTSTAITDGTVTWRYQRPQGGSIFYGSGGSATAASGVTIQGNGSSTSPVLPGGMTLYRNSGSATGTVSCYVASPCQDARPGQQLILNFSLGGGNTAEQWVLRLDARTIGTSGLLAADIGGPSWYAKADLDVLSYANLSGIYIDGPSDGSINFHNTAGSSAFGAGQRMAGHVGDVVTHPNGGKELLRTTPSLIPGNLSTCFVSLYFTFDASGAAGSATATIRVNSAGLYKVPTS